MPARIRLTLIGPPPPGPHRHADGLRAVTLKAVRRSLPVLAAWLHDANLPKPLAVGPMEPLIGHDGRHVIEIGCVADELLGHLIRGLPRPGGRIVLGRTPYDVHDIEVASVVAAADLAALPPSGQVIPLRFETPTAHHAPGPFRRSIVAPDPALYAGSWRTRWNLYAAPAIPDDLLRAVAERAAIRAFSGGTRAVPLDHGRVFIGFVGQVEIIVLGDDEEAADVLRTLWTLARFAEYCGTGVELMRGMGRTRIMHEVSEHGHTLR